MLVTLWVSRARNLRKHLSSRGLDTVRHRRSSRPSWSPYKWCACRLQLGSWQHGCCCQTACFCISSHLISGSMQLSKLHHALGEDGLVGLGTPAHQCQSDQTCYIVQQEQCANPERKAKTARSAWQVCMPDGA